MTTTAPDLATRQRAIAQMLTNTGYDLRNVHTIISDKPLPDCEWCADDGFHCPANCEIFHDTGSVLSCRHCLITAASVAAENSRYGEFSLEITEQPAKKYVAEAGLEQTYGAYVLRDGGEWGRCYIDLDDVSDDAS
jgi:hypothetical protein